MADLYPVFEVDEEEEFGDEEEILYKKDYKFDYSTGEFVKGSNDVMLCGGADAWIQWCQSVMRIERYQCLAYPDDIGVELEENIGLEDRDEAELLLQTTITDALLEDPEGRTESVSDFVFQWDGDGVYIECTIESTSGIIAVIDSEFNSRREGEIG